MFFKGVTFGFMAPHGYLSSDKAAIEIKRMKETGVEWVCLVATMWQEHFYSTLQFQDVELSPSDDEIIEAIRQIHNAGMKVYLRPMLQCLDGGMRMNIGFPGDGEIMPGRPMTYWRDWFANFQRLTRHFAALAERTGCEAYCMDSELNQTIAQDTLWRQTIEVARSVYKGHLTCVMSAVKPVLDTKDNCPNFWHCELDSFGLSAYPQVEDYPLDGHTPSVDEMIEKMKIWNDQYIAFGEKYPKICYLGECGTCSYHHASNAWEAKCRGLSNGFGQGLPFNEEEQANYLAAILKVYGATNWWRGLFWWKWDELINRPSFHDDPAGNKDWTLYGKAAAKVFKEWKNPENC